MFRSVASVIALITLVTGCSVRAAGDGPTMTQQQALARVEQLIKEPSR